MLTHEAPPTDHLVGKFVRITWEDGTAMQGFVEQREGVYLLRIGYGRHSLLIGIADTRGYYPITLVGQLTVL